MLKTIYNKYDKAMIPSLPIAQFPGRIIVILTPGETEKAVRYLLSQPILGFDTETRPSFKRGHQYKVSLLQVSTIDTCFLFRLNHTGLTPAIIQLLEDRTVKKIGLSWHDDLNSLNKIGNFKTGSFIEIQDLVRDLGIEDLSLQKLYANLFNQKISKRQQLSNWETDILTDKQKMYAATDAWACIMIYQEIIKLKESGNYKLIIKEEHNNE
ncbi:3'-5' exonuclease domain-containing protein 2 [Prevotella sp. E15-22]|jgi:ribonuclease D|uniref:3'-5' exonuclease n=1 Tax=Prevotella sp. E15-22 TaxID=2937774 RepID=UPI002063B17A|nr:3'-5' exonuclease domain-containing protein 2 [Prevotella sp. E15-22]UPS45812.1 3'-5' exonuclease domain-containing protein 2 [Prevotella sp. E15-22]